MSPRNAARISAGVRVGPVAATAFSALVATLPPSFEARSRVARGFLGACASEYSSGSGGASTTGACTGAAAAGTVTAALQRGQRPLLPACSSFTLKSARQAAQDTWIAMGAHHRAPSYV